MNKTHPTHLIMVVGAMIVVFYFIASPYHNCLRDGDADAVSTVFFFVADTASTISGLLKKSKPIKCRNDTVLISYTYGGKKHRACVTSNFLKRSQDDQNRKLAYLTQQRYPSWSDKNNLRKSKRRSRKEFCTVKTSW